jgi:hypothetical protein
LHAPLDTPWADNKYGLAMEAARRLATNRWWRVTLDAEALCSRPARAVEIDYATVDEANLSTAVTLEASRPATAHGFCAWFDSVLAPGVTLAAGPGTTTIYGSAFFPFPEPVQVDAGDRIEARLTARLMHGEYLWTWETRIMRAGSERHRFRQSDFFSEPLAPAKLRRHSAGHVASLTEDATIDAAIIGLMGERLTLGEVARQIAQRHPDRFVTWHDALERVADLSSRYSKA